MSIANEIERIQTDKVTIRAKLKEFGLVEDAATLDDCANAMDGITKYGALSPEILEGRSYTIPAGYHDGSGVVKAITDEEGDKTLRYKTQSKNVIPAKQQKSVAPDDGFYALSSVTVEPIPSNYQDVTATTAEPSDVLTGAVFVKKDGTVKAGEMPNNGAVTQTIDLVQQVYRIPKGYHDGNGTVRASMQTMSATPTKEEQTVVSPIGKLLSEVKVAPIPDAYQDVTGVTATADKVLTGSKFVDAEGNVVDGTMVDHSDTTNISLYPNCDSYTIPKGYHSGDFVVKALNNTQRVTPTKEEQTVVAPITSESVDEQTGYMVVPFLSEVIVNPIPAAYQDVTGVDCDAFDVLEGRVFVDAKGNEVEGTIPIKDAVYKTLDTTTTSVAVPVGYYGDEGGVYITLEEKTETPSKSTKTVTPSAGKVLSKVTVNPIPAAYQDVTGVTATADKVLTGSKFVDATGKVVNGTMTDHSSKGIIGYSHAYASYFTIPEGYYNGSQKVSAISIVPQSVTPTKEKQRIVGEVIEGDNGEEYHSFIRELTVNPIPDEYQDITRVTANGDDVLEGKVYVNADGELIDGSMPNKGAVSLRINGMSTTPTVTIPEGYHNGGGTVSLTDDIENALKAI